MNTKIFSIYHNCSSMNMMKDVASVIIAKCWDLFFSFPSQYIAKRVKYNMQ